ncbi:MAG: hypothetical protein SFX18_00240 [Pirellulales bacterium]|nr:hypothetical protein [Pirellulales bacterium]
MPCAEGVDICLKKELPIKKPDYRKPVWDLLVRILKILREKDRNVDGEDLKYSSYEQFSLQTIPAALGKKFFANASNPHTGLLVFCNGGFFFMDLGDS